MPDSRPPQLLPAPPDGADLIAPSLVRPEPRVPPPGDRAAMVSLQERLIERALEAGASDLHIEPFPDRVRLRLRIDGWLHELDALPRWMHAGLVSRIKVMAAMDVTERRRPQDGRAHVRAADGQDVDLRIASAATQHGEKVTIRLLPRSRRPPDLSELGLDEPQRRRIEALISMACGLVLAAGPTGAGKTTTLHAMLQRIDAVGRSVVTLEDPIEYDLPGAAQMPVRASIGVDFPAALRAILRHDPDVILLGEIRDEETARIAVRAATTGHLVLSTVHTNGAAEAISRLYELGVPPYLVAAALVGVVSQRLVRRLCHLCRQPAPEVDETLARLGLDPRRPGDRFYSSAGCDACRDGFEGRIGIFEILTLAPHLRRLVATASDCLRLERAARRAGELLPLLAAAGAAARRGITTLAEIERVVPPAAEGLSRTAPGGAPGRAHEPVTR